MATAEHRSAAQGNPLAGLIRSGRFEVSVVKKFGKREMLYLARRFRPNDSFAGRVPIGIGGPSPSVEKRPIMQT